MWRLWRRIRAAAKVAFVPGDHMPVTRADLADIRREHTEWVRDLTDILEKLNMWHARQAKREQRALKASLTAQPETREAPSGNRKLALYRRVAAGGGASQISLPIHDDGDDEP